MKVVSKAVSLCFVIIAIFCLSGCVEVSKAVHSAGVAVFGESPEDKKLTELGKDYVIFFFQEGDLYCRNMAIFVKSFSENYKWKVCEITPKSSEKSGYFDWISNDEDLMKKFEVKICPTAFVVHQKANIALKVIDGDYYGEFNKRIVEYLGKISPRTIKERSLSKSRPKLWIIDGIDKRARKTGFDYKEREEPSWFESQAAGSWIR